MICVVVIPFHWFLPLMWDTVPSPYPYPYKEPIMPVFISIEKKMQSFCCFCLFVFEVLMGKGSHVRGVSLAHDIWCGFAEQQNGPALCMLLGRHGSGGTTAGGGEGGAEWAGQCAWSQWRHKPPHCFQRRVQGCCQGTPQSECQQGHQKYGENSLHGVAFSGDDHYQFDTGWQDTCWCGSRG